MKQNDKTIYAFRVYQHHADYPMYVFKCRIQDLLKFVEVVPTSEEHPEYPQRPLKPRRAQDIAAYYSKGRPLAPALIINFDKTNPPAEQEINGVTDSYDLVKLTVKLDGPKAYCMDGQHRLWAFDPNVHQGKLTADVSRAELSIVAFLGIDMNDLSEQFITINTEQEKVTKEQIKTVEGASRRLIAVEQWAFDVVKKLNEMPDSPLFKQVLFYPGEKRKIIKNARLCSIVENYARSLNAASPHDAAMAIANYLKAWVNTYKTEWSDAKQHMLTTAVGIESLLSVYDTVNARRQAKHAVNVNLECWQDILAGIKAQEFILPEINYKGKHISWRKSEFKVMASGKHNVEALRKAFADMVVRHLKAT
jgi:DGQHR domain-containing protein